MIFYLIDYYTVCYSHTQTAPFQSAINLIKDNTCSNVAQMHEIQAFNVNTKLMARRYEHAVQCFSATRVATIWDDSNTPQAIRVYVGDDHKNELRDMVQLSHSTLTYKDKTKQYMHAKAGNRLIYISR